MVAYYNCYAFTNAEDRVILDLGLPYTNAVERCEYEAQFLADEFHRTLFRHGDTWYEDGWLPRVCLWNVRADPFEERMKGVQWMPEID